MCSSTFPNKYPKGQKCIVDVETPPFSWLKITFCYFNVVYSRMCKGDRFVVLDRAMSASGADPPCENKYQRVRRFCNIQTRRVYYVKTPNARLKFQSNKDRFVRKGFKIHIQAIKSPCALELMPPKGVIKVTHMKGVRYHSNYYCHWEYKYGHTENEAFHLTCPKFYVHEGVKHMQSSPDCVHVSSNGTEASFTGKKGPEYVSHGGDVTFEFFANRRHHSKGFTCQYHINAPGDVGGLCLHQKNCNGTRLHCVKQICTCLSNYTLVTIGGKESCAEPIAVGQSGCTADADCELNDALSFCDSGTCKCKPGHAEHAGKCHGHKKINEPCLTDAQCTLTKNAGKCTGGKCTCSSGHTTTTCGGGKYTGCYPMLVVPAGTKGKSMAMPVSHNTKFCTYNFQHGSLWFYTGNRLGIKYVWQRTSGKNNLKVYRKVGASWKFAHTRTFSLYSNPDFFWLWRTYPNQLLYTGAGGIISHPVKAWPPYQWASVYLWSSNTKWTKSVVFVEP